MAKTTKNQAMQSLITHLRNPVKLRFACVALLWIVGYGVFVRGQKSKISEEEQHLAVETKRVVLCMDIEKLKKDLEECNKHVRPYAQDNEWVEDILTETRNANLLVASEETKANATSTHGPYTLLVMKMELQGTYLGFLNFVRWCDSPERTMRIDSLKLEREPGFLYCEINIRGLIKNVVSASAEKAKTGKALSSEKKKADAQDEKKK